MFPPSAQAYQTMRKGNKVFAVFDLTVTLDWKGRWLEDGKEVRPPASWLTLLPIWQQ